MFLDDISIQASILIYAGLGLVFFLGIGYYFYQNPFYKGVNRFWPLFLGTIRGLILVGLFIAIFPFKMTQDLDFNPEDEFVFIVDFPDQVSKEFLRSFSKTDSIIKVYYPNVTWKDFLGHDVRNFQKPIRNSRSFNQLNQSFRGLMKRKIKPSIFILTDGNVNEMDSDLNLGSKVHIIPYGFIDNKQQIAFSASRVPLISVPGEEIHFPIDIWLKNFNQDVNVFLSMYLDGIYMKKQLLAFRQDQLYHSVDFSLISDKVGKHKIKLISDDGFTLFLDWNVVHEKAVVYGFTDVLDPDVGVLNRIAKNKFIKLIWNFDDKPKNGDFENHYIFKGFLPKWLDKSRINKAQTLFLDISKENINPYLNPNKNGQQVVINLDESLWDLQMTEFQNKGRSTQVDSTVGAWYEQLFLGNSLNGDSLNADSPLMQELYNQDSSKPNFGRNDTKLNYLASKKNVDLLEISDLGKDNFIQKESEWILSQESEYFWKNIYFKLLLILFVLLEWLCRKFNEMR